MGEERYYVYYDAGSCHDGDHSTGMEEFPTEAAARAFMSRWHAENYTYGENGCTLIRGVEVA